MNNTSARFLSTLLILRDFISVRAEPSCRGAARAAVRAVSRYSGDREKLENPLESYRHRFHGAFPIPEKSAAAFSSLATIPAALPGTRVSQPVCPRPPGDDRPPN